MGSDSGSSAVSSLQHLYNAATHSRHDGSGTRGEGSRVGALGSAANILSTLNVSLLAGGMSLGTEVIFRYALTTVSVRNYRFNLT